MTVLSSILLSLSAVLAPSAGSEANDELHWDLLPEVPTEFRDAAFAAIAERPNDRLSYLLLDLLRLADTPESWYRALDALSSVTGTKLREVERPWRTLRTQWAAAPPTLPADYLSWKGELLAQAIDPRFRDLIGAARSVADGFEVHEVVWGGVGVDGLPDLTRPRTVPAVEATFLAPNEAVFGVVLEGRARAYPLRILDWHELVNDVVAGRPVALAWCTLCGAAILYDTRVGERTLEFGTSGLLARSNKLMYDKETQSLWSQTEGRPVLGPLVEQELELDVLPLVATTWSSWRTRHPTTDVVALPTGFERRYEPGAAYAEYFGSRETWFPVGTDRFQRPKKDLVFVLRSEAMPRGYPLAALERVGGLVHDDEGAEPTLVIAPERRALVLPESWRAALAIETTSELDTSAAERLSKSLELLNEASEEVLLALRAEPRRRLLEALQLSDADQGSSARRALAERVTNHAWAVDVRAYRSGDRTFQRAQVTDQLIDQDGQAWNVTDAGLVGPRTVLERLPGHLQFWFAWEGSRQPRTTWSD